MATTRKGGLGRGLSALIPTDAPPGSDGPFRTIPLDAIVPNSYQPREDFDEVALAALADSIRELGVLQPVLVRPGDDDRFELIAGERRWRAAALAGLANVPAIVREVDDQTSLAHAIVENVQRAELNPIEEAAAFQQLIDEFELTQEDVAQRVGRSRPAVANSLRLLQLPAEIQRHIIDGRLSAGHGRALVPLDDPQRDRLVAKVLDEELSVRVLEELIREGEAKRRRPSSDGDVGKTKPAALLELEQLLGERFDTPVKISLASGRGRIVIDFADVDDLERIYALIIE